MKTDDKKLSESPPPLWIPGWAIPVYFELSNPNGTDALQKAILGLMRAGSPRVVGSLARELCIQEEIVESALKHLAEADFIFPSKDADLWELSQDKKNEEVEITRELGWIFWDSLRKRILPTLLADENGKSLDQLPKPTDITDDCSVSHYRKPFLEEVRREMLPTIECQNFSLWRLKKGVKGVEFEPFSVDRLQRISLQEGARHAQWHPLFVPYEVDVSSSSFSSIYCCEPLYCSDLQPTVVSPYSPFLRSLIENKLPSALFSVSTFIARKQAEMRSEEGVVFLSTLGGPERIIEQAREEVQTMLDGALSDGPFSVPELKLAAEEAERIWITTAALGQSDESLRYQYSRLLQFVAASLSNEMLWRWQSSKAARDYAQWYPSQREANRSRIDFREVSHEWNNQVAAFSRSHGVTFDKWNIKTAGELYSDSIYDLRRTQLGIVLRSWAAFSIVAENEDEGKFVLAWIREALRCFPQLFEVFEESAKQRNVDKNRNSVGFSVHVFRQNIYDIWKAIGCGYSHARILETESRKNQ